MKDDYKIYGIVYRCPVLIRKDDCPLIEIDYFPFKEKVIWIEGLSRDEKEMIMEHHRVCSIDRGSL
jgi:hypothetical protein